MCNKEWLNGESRVDVVDVMKGIAWGVVICAIITMCSSCRGVRTQVVERVRIDSVYVERVDSVVKEIVKRDSVYVRDSISTQWKGDTCYVDRWHYEFWEASADCSLLEKQQEQRQEVRVDSIPVVVEVEKVKEVKVLAWWWKMVMGLMGGVIVWLVGMKIIDYLTDLKLEKYD